MHNKDDRDRGRGTTANKRPAPPKHTSSFSRRHASFDSPREVPLPSSSSSHQQQPAQPQSPGMRQQDNSSHFSPVFADEPDWELISAGGSKLHKEKSKAQGQAQPQPPPPPPPPPSFSSKTIGKLKSSLPPPSFTQGQGGTKETILPFSRPYSLPEAHSYQGRSSAKHDAAAPGAPAVVDRTSSASLPLPMQIPFSVLPKVGVGKRPGMPSPVYERTAAEAQLRPPMPTQQSSGSGRSSRSSNDSSDSLLSAPPSPVPSARRASPPPAPAPPSASPSASTSSASASKPTSKPASTSAPKPKQHQLRSGAAPMPPPELSTSNSGSVASYRPPRTTYSPVPPTPPDSAATAISRTPSLRKYPPPEPPVILAGGADGVVGGGGAGAPPVSSRASSAGAGPSSPSSGGSVRSSGASYEPFLSHAPPPVDSWIEVETTQGEYRLIVRLPGFKRDGITLATKKRRILHVVADSWDEPGGGHFERRISFGYDADLAQVRAEFDGELLRIIIPRRMPVGVGVGVEGYAMAGAPSGRR